MAILLGSGQGRAGDPALAARERREAEEHVGRCSDCWAMLSLLHELATGEPVAGAEEGSAGARAEGGVPAAGLATVGRVEPRAARPRPRRDGAARLGT